MCSHPRYADQSWYRLIEGAQTFLVEEFAVTEPATVLMRAIDIVGLSRSKALLFQMEYGQGHILGTGLHVYQQCTQASCPLPEKAWVLDRLLRYGGELLRR